MMEYVCMLLYGKISYSRLISNVWDSKKGLKTRNAVGFSAYLA